MALDIVLKVSQVILGWSKNGRARSLDVLGKNLVDGIYKNEAKVKRGQMLGVYIIHRTQIAHDWWHVIHEWNTESCSLSKNRKLGMSASPVVG